MTNTSAHRRHEAPDHQHDEGCGAADQGDAPRAGRPRSTRQATALDGALTESNGFRSAQDLHAELRTRGDGIGLTTVYRRLQGLVDDGLVDMIRTTDGEALYRKCEVTSHHHHVVCRRCGRAAEVQGQAVERWAAQVAAQHGFREVEHTFEVSGICSDCG